MDTKDTSISSSGKTPKILISAAHVDNIQTKSMDTQQNQKCDICSKSFFKASKLIQHKIKKHGIK